MGKEGKLHNKLMNSEKLAEKPKPRVAVPGTSGGNYVIRYCKYKVAPFE